jgi:ATP adenylyltransferase
MRVERELTEKSSEFAPGTLMERLRASSADALRCRALQPIKTQSLQVEDRGVQFLVRVVSNLGRKPAHNGHKNPFLPYEQDLFVADVTPTHVGILNKYNVVDLHLLIITRAFEHQESRLNLRDFQALWRCLVEFDSLGFYNSGQLSGASQPHKHLQLVPLPLAGHGTANSVPLEPMLRNATGTPGVIGEMRDVSFAHSLVCWDPTQASDPESMARQSLDCYEQMLARHRLLPALVDDDRVVGSYNLLVTRRWMLLVPRIRECFQTISFNSLAFVGALLVRDPVQMDLLRSAGPFAALESVAAVRPRRAG